MSETTRWWWIRHAPVTVNQGRIYGQTDHPCDCDDPAVFQALARLLPPEAVWVTSSLKRTHQTADAVRVHLPAGLPDYERHADLAEQHFGDWQGRTYDEVRDGSQGHWHRFWLSPAAVAPPGGESFVDLMARVVPAVHRLNDLYRGRDIVAVTHGGTIRAALAEALRLEPEAALRLVVDNCSLTRIDHVPGPTGSHAPDETHAWRVEFANLSPRRLVGAGVAGAPA
jgi:broad specificity phosphatase PhoE